MLIRKLGLAESVPINVEEPELLKEFDRQLIDLPLERWRTWLRWRVLKISAPYLSSAIVTEDFRFNSTILSGIEAQRPRWQVCTEVVDRNLGDALGAAFVSKHFSSDAKARMDSMVENLRRALRQELEDAKWLRPETRASAIRKLDALSIEIGSPSRWRDYSTVKFDRNTYFENVRAAWLDNQQYELAKIGKPVDRTAWSMTPPTVNASSNPKLLRIIFPAGIVQPPFFDMYADDAANYGAIGSIIGHEIVHLFDDQGSKYDETGALRNWWTPGDRTEFDTRTNCIVDQFNTIDIGGGLHHNGKLVLGEAMGDLGGVTLAYRAYHRSIMGKPAPPVMDGFTAEQRFFIGFARRDGNQMRPEAERLALTTDSHPLSKYRVIATLQNLIEFQRAFHCKLGDPMVRDGERCKLW
jgi:endothelin-converting enzyme/putative endopeptidase